MFNSFASSLSSVVGAATGSPAASSSVLQQWGSTPLQELRKKQIASLTAANLVPREIHPGTHYEIVIQLPSHPIFLQIKLPPSFPEVPPELQVRPLFSHPWIQPGTGNVVGLEKITSGWNQHVSLGKAVGEIVKEFGERNPVKVDGVVGGSLTSALSGGSGSGPVATPPPYPAKPAGISGSGSSSSASSNSGAGGAGGDMMGLENKTLEELEEMMNDERAFEDHLFNLPGVKEHMKSKREFIAGNEQLARNNLGTEEQLEGMKGSIREKQQEFNKVRNEYEELVRSYQDETLRFAPDYLISRLRDGATESEELSESIAQSFLEGKVNVEDFLKNFRETRKVYHQRAMKLERVTRDPQILSTT
ncbi:hypothetical protein HDU76_013727 [Blyttiomyces sp. JEL0837]|nr:hypothetical protein HDU76_013727 [Blyttiomyces sp. JEL0837]